MITTTTICFSTSNPSYETELLNKANENPLNCAYCLANKLGGFNKRAVFKQIAINFAKTGEYDLAYKIAKSYISIDEGQIAIFYEIARNYANAGLSEKAVSLLTEASQSVDLWTDAADIYFSLGQKEPALKILEKDFNIAKDLPDDETNYRELELMDVVKSYANMGEYNQAYKVINVIPKPYNSNALSIIALSFADKQQYDQALQVASKIESNILKVNAFTQLAERLIKDGQKDNAVKLLDQALQIGSSLDVGYSKALYLANLANVYFGVGKKDKSLEILSSSLESTKLIKNPDSKDAVLRELSIAYGKIAEYEKALKVIDSIQFPPEKIYSLKRISRAYTQINEKNKALTAVNTAFQIANHMNDGSSKDIALLEVATEYGDLGDFSQALKVVKLINGMFRKAQALADIGLAYKKGGLELDNIQNILDDIIHDSINSRISDKIKK